MKTITTNLKRASIEIILLSLLTEGDMYGYQLSQEIKKRTDNKLSVLEGSMYTILNRLKDNNDVTFYTKIVGTKMVRVYYSITETGRAHLAEMTEIFNTDTDLIKSLINK